MSELTPQKYLSTADAAKIADCTPGYIAKLCRHGYLPGTRSGSSWLVSESDLSSYLSSVEKERSVRREELAREQEYRAHQPLARRQLSSLSTFARSHAATLLLFVAASSLLASANFVGQSASLGVVPSLSSEVAGGSVSHTIGESSFGASSGRLMVASVLNSLSESNVPFASNIASFFGRVLAFFTGGETATLAVVPVAFPSVQPDVVTVSAPAYEPASEAIVVSGNPQTIVQNVYPTTYVTNEGTSKSYVDIELARLSNIFSRNLDNIPSRASRRVGPVVGTEVSATSLSLSGDASIAGLLTVANMGVGTSSPNSTLSVQGNALFSGDLRIANLTATGTATIGTLTLASALTVPNGGTGSTTLSGILAGNGTSGIQSAVIGSGLSWDGTTLTSISGTVASGLAGQFPYYATDGSVITATSSIFLAASGNVGIGTSSPTSNLSIESAASASQSLLANSGAALLTLTSYRNSAVTHAGIEGLGARGTSASPSVVQSGDALLSLRSGGWDGTSFYTSGFDNSAAIDLVADENFTSGLNHAGKIVFYTMASGDNYKSNRMVIGSGGNVGIGSTSPYAKLSIKGAGSTTGVNFQTTNSSNSPLFTILDSGNVGIGTTNPGAVLDVAGNIRVNASGQHIQLWNDNVGLARASNNLILGGYGGIDFKSSNTSGIENQTTRMFIDAATGNVGIGTTTPAAQLQLTTPAGSVSMRYAQSGGTSRNVDITLGTGIGGYGGVSLGSTANANSVAYGWRTQASGNYEFLIDQGGNVGIGSTSPYAKLSVKGAGTASGVNFQTTNSSDSPLLTILDSGNVGVGTVSPTAKFQISDSGFNLKAGNATGLGVYTTGTQAWTNLGTDGAALIAAWYNSSNQVQGSIAKSGGISIGSGYVTTDPGAGNMIISGNVGIGTTTPGYALDVQKYATPTVARFYGGAAANPTDGIFMVAVGSGSNYTGYNAAYTSSWIAKHTGAVVMGANGGDMSVYTDSGLTVNSSYTPTERLTIKSTGNVGIGTTSPTAALALVSNAANRFIVESTSGSNTRDIEVDSSGNITLGYGYKPTDDYALRTISSTRTVQIGAGGIKFLNASAPATLLKDSANYALISQGYDGVSSYKTFGFGSLSSITFSGNGNTGIGTTTPLAKLDIAGTNNATTPLFQLSSVSAFATTTRLIVTNAGNMGINTTSVTGTGSTTLQIAGTGGGANQYGSLSLSNASGSGNNFAGALDYYVQGNLISSIRSQVVGGGNSGALYFYTANGGTLNQTFGISTTGSTTVGSTIGLANTQAKLTVSANSFGGTLRGINITNDNTGNNSNTEFGFASLNASGSVIDVAVLRGLKTTSTTGAEVGEFSISTRNAGTLQESLRINGAGNVGIGTTTPGAKLDVYLNPSNTYSTEKVTFGPSITVANYGSAYSGLWLGGTVGQNTPSATNYTLISDGSGPILNAPTSGALRFSIGNAAKMTISSVGNVGVGTATPGAPFAVASPDAGSGFSSVNTWANYSIFGPNAGNSVGAALGLGYSSTDDAANIVSAQPSTGWKPLRIAASTLSVLSNGNVQGLYQDVLGNVGIGTTSPGAKLEVSTNVNEATLIGNQSASIASLGLSNVTSGVSFRRASDGSVTNGIFNYGDTGGTPSLGIVARNDISFFNNLTPSLTIKLSGNVGIGTTSPGAKLEIYGGELRLNDGSGNHSGFTFNTTNGLAQTNNNPFTLQGALRVNSSAGGNSYIVGAGNVGIGISAPADKLHVEGNIYLGTTARTIYQGGAATLSLQTNTGDISFNTANGGATPLFIKASTGNVGIGTINPLSKLDVVIATTTADITHFRTLDTSIGVQGGVALIGDMGANTNNGIWLRMGYGDSYVGTTDIVSNGIARIFTGNPKTERMRIDSSGNVGIGTTSPQSNVKLDVHGRIVGGLNHVGESALTTSSGEFWLSAKSLVTIGESSAGDANPAITLYRTAAGYSTGRAVRIYSPNSSGVMQFQIAGAGTTYGSETFNTVMQLTTAGYVNIGTTTAQSMLAVQGTGGAPLLNLYTTAGASVVTVNSAGYVGIGTTTPSTKLTISSASDNNAQLLITSAAGANALRAGTFTGGDGFLQFWDGAGNATIQMRGNGTSYFNSGNVGIGTTSPYAKLSVTGDLALTGGIYDNTASRGTNGMVLQTTGTGVQWVATSSLGFASAANAFIQGGNSFGAAAILGTNDAQNLAFETSGTTRLTIDTSGNVGLGTSSPLNRLDIVGNARIYGDTQGYIFGDLTLNYAALLQYRSSLLGLSNIANLRLAGNSGGISAFTISDYDSAIRFIVNRSGSIGIGTTTPDSRLNVFGGQLKISNGTGNSYATRNTGIVFARTDFPNSYTNKITNSLSATLANTTMNFELTDGTGAAFTNVMTLTGAGNVGIGTTSPQRPLQVTGTTPLRLERSNIGWYDFTLSGGSVSSDTLDLVFQNGQNGGYLFTTNSGNTNALAINNAGNVGIGTTSPYAKLSVKGAGTTTGVNFQTTNSSDSPLFTILDSGKVGIGTASPTQKFEVIGNIYSNTGNFLVTGEKGLQWADNGSYIARFGATGDFIINPTVGNVGIGTTTPDALLTLSKAENNTLINITNQSVAGTPSQFKLRFDTGGNTIMENLRVAGVNQFVLGITGNVGIGTTTPAEKLHVVGGNIRLGDASNNNGAYMDFLGYSGGVNFRIGQSSANLFEITPSTVAGGSTFTNKAFVVTNGGNVGIGTTSPTAKLQVDGGAIGTPIAIFNTNFGSSGSGIGLYSDTNSAGNRNWSIGTNNTTYGDFSINQSNAKDGNPLSAGTSRFYIQDTGNVGIGTTNPSTKLQISANTGTAGFESTFAITNDVDSNFFIQVTGSAATDKRTQIGPSTPTALTFATDATERMRITTGGNVGIGTTNPITKFAVSSGGNEGIELAPAGFGVGTSILQFYNRGDSTYDNAYIDALSFQFGINGVAKVNIAASGNVGIGTTSPTAKLHVQQTVGTAAAILSTPNGNLTFIPGFSDSYSYIQDSSANGLILSAQGAGNLPSFNVAATKTVFAGGNVGIGTTTPAWNLDVNGTSRFGTYGVGGVLIGYAGNDIQGRTAADGNGNLLLNLYGGNVGIGTAAPGSKLSIQGGSLSATSAYDLNFASQLSTGRLSTSGSSKISSIHTYYDDATVELSAGSSAGYISGITIAGRSSTATPGESVALWTRSLQRLTVDGAGNVGIGSTTPYAKLSVTGTGGTTRDLVVNGRIQTGDANNQGGVWFGQTDQAQFIGQQSATTLGFYTNSDWRMVINSSGNVGIGTTNPGNKLTVSGTGSGIISAVDTSSTGYSGVSLQGTGTQNYSLVMGGPSESVFGIANKFALYDGLAGAMRFVVDSSGNVGIGTTSPVSKLAVEGTSNILTMSGTSANAANYINFLSLGGSSARNDWRLGTGIGVDDGFEIYDATAGGPLMRFTRSSAGVSTGTLNFYTNAATARLTIDTSGNVGIGTTTPSQALSVQGNGLFSGSLSVSGVVATGTIRVGTNTILSNGGLTVLDDSGAFGRITTKHLDSPSGQPLYLSYYNGGAVIVGANARANVEVYGSQNLFNTASTSMVYFTPSGSSYINGGNLGIGTTSPAAQLTTTGTVQFANFGAGSLQTDANGNLSVSSDERLKTLNGSFTRGLDAVLGLSPILYHWNATSKLDQATQYAGFSAQNVKASIPEAVDTDPRGYLTLSDRPILAASINAIKELNNKTITLGEYASTTGRTVEDLGLALDMIASTTIATTSSSTPGSIRFATSFWKNVFAKVSEWIGDSANGIKTVVAGQLRAKESICVDDQCLSKDDVRVLLEMARERGSAGVGASVNTPTPTPTPEPVSPAPTDDPSVVTPPTPVTETPAPTPTPEPQPAPTPEPVVTAPVSPTPEPVTASPVTVEATTPTAATPAI